MQSHFRCFIGICTFFFLFMIPNPSPCSAESNVAADTAVTDTVQKPAGYLEGVDVKVVYSWAEDEPDTCVNVKCQLITENGQVVKIKIFKKDCTDEIRVKPGMMTFEIRDHKTGKLIAKGS